MQIKWEFPPNIDEINKHFKPTNKTVFTYKPYLYNPYNVGIPENLMVHESVHLEQQFDPAAWWHRYITDIEFRLDQELRAYQKQFKFFKAHHPYNYAKFLHFIARDLSGPLYANCISYGEALTQIQNN